MSRRPKNTDHSSRNLSGEQIGHESNAVRRRRRHLEEQSQYMDPNASQTRNQLEGRKVYADPDDSSLECAVCLNTCLYPTVLPCGHIFCYLCVKGSVRTGPKTCPMCRSHIPNSIMMNPVLYEPIKPTSDSGVGGEHSFKWFYQRRRTPGWWQYDDRTSDEIEAAYKNGMKTLEILICGEMYVIDLEAGRQYPKSDSTRERKIIRSTLDTIDVTGVSGIV